MRKFLTSILPIMVFVFLIGSILSVAPMQKDFDGVYQFQALTADKVVLGGGSTHDIVGVSALSIDSSYVKTGSGSSRDSPGVIVALILSALFMVCIYCLYVQTIKLFRNRRLYYEHPI